MDYEAEVSLLPRKHQQLHSLSYLKGSLQSRLLSKSEPDPAPPSNQYINTGDQPHPFDMQVAKDFSDANVHHSTCIRTKTDSTVGLGFKTDSEDFSKEEEILDPLCNTSFQDVISDACDDYWQLGNGYLEIVRDSSEENSPIIGIHEIPGEGVQISLENVLGDIHYLVRDREGGMDQRFPSFGGLASFQRRMKANGSSPFGFDPNAFSEIIPFRKPSSRHRHYGYPDWLAAVAEIELTQCILQHEFDFYLNRGVPEMIIVTKGQTHSKKDKERINTALSATMGLGNQHKSIHIDLPNPDADLDIHKLAMESKGDASIFTQMAESLALHIVSAHRVPPLLAGIQIPGKLGASNEMVQALMGFHLLVIAPAQRIFRRVLVNTLGNPRLNGGLSLSRRDFNFNTLKDELDLNALDTVARMRQSPQEAKAQGRDLSEGTKD